MTIEFERAPDLEWLDHVQPVGLVVAPTLLDDLGLVPIRQTQLDSAQAAELIDQEVERKGVRSSALTDPWAFVSTVLGWQPQLVAGSPAGPPLPDELSVRLTDHDTTLVPTWALIERGESQPGFQLLVRIEPPGVAADARGALGGWEATPHQRFERLLRETGVFAGLMITNDLLRLTYAPRGETSGYLDFPIRPLATVAGRPMLGGLKLLLDSTRLFTDATDRRLPALLKKSREAQAHVSTELAGQVLGALHELLRGLDAADPDLIRNLARECPDHLYEGLLAVLMRLVFILYAEDRDLMPSRRDGWALSLYERSYSLRGLYAKLVQDAALNPDTMDERRGGWGQLLAIFRLVHGGHSSGLVQARGGGLFDPHTFSFLEGRKEKTDQPRVLAVSDGCILRILAGLMTLARRGRARERLSYRTLDVEQIGSVYEVVMGFTVQPAAGPSVAIKAGKSNRTPVFIDLAQLVARRPEDRLKYLKRNAKRGQLSGTQTQALKQAKSIEELGAALAGIVDERGSPNHSLATVATPLLQPTEERRRTGSHYTPRTLTEPIVRHALEPAFEQLGPDATPDRVLDLRICDPAMGSGAFLVEACRAIATRLVQAWARWPEKRPTIPLDEDEDLHPRRLVAQRCLYGVDKNPRAVELARLSLWLATLAKDHEFTFLDHALKCGDSLVGLTKEQMERATWRAPTAPRTLFSSLIEERVQVALHGRAEIREAPDDVGRAVQEARYRTIEQRLDQARLIGDAVVAAFFAAGKPKKREEQRREVESWLQGGTQQVWDKLAGRAVTLRQGAERGRVRPFHWELEFPEVFARENPGFDAVVGNPPFLGGRRISSEFGNAYRDWLPVLHPGAHGNSDLAAHFFRRAFVLIRRGGAFGLIATNTIRQGETRTSGLAPIVHGGGSILRARRRYQWPGEAAVVVSIIHLLKGDTPSPVLDGRECRRISSYLVEGDLDTAPANLVANAGKAFQGSIVLNMGFTFDDKNLAKGASPLCDRERLITQDPTNANRIFPFMGGEELNNDPRQAHRRFVIDFEDISESAARAKWPALVDILEQRVRTERQEQKREDLRNRWWQFAYRKKSLYETIKKLPIVLATNCGAAPHLAWAFIPSNQVYAHSLVIVAFSINAPFAVLQSRVHELWARFFSSTLEDRLRYTPKTCFRTFPFPEGFETDPTLQATGEAYHALRADIMVKRNEGLTKIYNRFHNAREKATDLERLRELHAATDAAVLRAYGWNDLAERARPLFIEQDVDEGKPAKTRLDWPDDTKDELLANLLALNAERAKAERAQGVSAAEPEEDDEEFVDDEELVDEEEIAEA